MRAIFFANASISTGPTLTGSCRTLSFISGPMLSCQVLCKFTGDLMLVPASYNNMTAPFSFGRRTLTLPRPAVASWFGHIGTLPAEPREWGTMSMTRGQDIWEAERPFLHRRDLSAPVLQRILRPSRRPRHLLVAIG